jgi:hypothetical protein
MTAPKNAAVSIMPGTEEDEELDISANFDTWRYDERTGSMEFPYRVALEEFLEAGLRAQEQPVVKVTIADDGETATVQMTDKCTQYRLSSKAQERVRTGVEVSLVGDERFLLPIDAPKEEPL